ncbi:phosphotransferase [Arthrobacter sp. UYCo732]|uniref:phosphotransferase n=1 Tax=Arthrobacter sp. UYCo732 TaxID=3156336 RepID=UPI003393DB2D
MRWVHGVPAADVGPASRRPALWEQACAAEAWGGPAVMLLGDLHPGNILLGAGGSLAGVIDFGDVGAGDPAVDLATP